MRWYCKQLWGGTKEEWYTLYWYGLCDSCALSSWYYCGVLWHTCFLSLSYCLSSVTCNPITMCTWLKPKPKRLCACLHLFQQARQPMGLREVSLSLGENICDVHCGAPKCCCAVIWKQHSPFKVFGECECGGRGGRGLISGVVSPPLPTILWDPFRGVTSKSLVLFFLLSPHAWCETLDKTHTTSLLFTIYF